MLLRRLKVWAVEVEKQVQRLKSKTVVLCEVFDCWQLGPGVGPIYVLLIHYASLRIIILSLPSAQILPKTIQSIANTDS